MRLPVLVLALASLSPAPLPGPGAVIDMHVRLFAALDAGDSEAAQAFLTGSPYFGLFLVDGEGRPAKATSLQEGKDLLARLAGEAKKAGGTWRTAIVSDKAECTSPEFGFATLEFRREHTVDGKTVARTWRSTSLGNYRAGQWRLFHWHVSPGEAVAAPR